MLVTGEKDKASSRWAAPFKDLCSCSLILWQVGWLSILLGCSPSSPDRTDRYGSSAAVLQPPLEGLLPVALPPASATSAAPADESAIQEIQTLVEKLKWLCGVPQPNPARLALGYGELGKVFQAYRLYPNAEPCYANARILAPQSYQWSYYLAKVKKERAKLEEAKDLFHETLQKKPTYSPAMEELAEWYLEEQNLDQAEALYRSALAINPTSMRARLGWGKLAAARGDLDKAIEVWESLLAEQPGLESVGHQLGLAYRDRGDLDKARRYLENPGREKLRIYDPLMEALEAFSLNQAQLRQGRVALERAQYDQAQRIFAALTVQDPQNSIYRFGLARAYFGAKKMQEAETELLRILQASPKDPRANFYLGTLYLLRSDLEGAVHHLDLSLANNPDQADAQFNLGKAQGLRDQYAAATQAFENASRQDPGNPDARYWLAFYQMKQGRYAEAQTTLAAAHDAFPQHEGLALLGARLLSSCPDSNFRNGTKAASLLNRTFSTTDPTTVAIVRGMVAAEQGDFTAATGFQRQAMNQLEKQGQTANLKAVETLLDLYRSKSPCRELFWFETLVAP